MATPDDAKTNNLPHRSNSSRVVPLRDVHLGLLEPNAKQSDQELTDSPIFTAGALSRIQSTRPSGGISQYGLLAGISEGLEDAKTRPTAPDPRVFLNVTTPSSTFICGSQGSGKSHTLSCILENCLIKSGATELPRPLTGLVFHYDTFVSDVRGAPCEAAYLSSDMGVKVRVLCSPTNLHTIRVSHPTK